MVTVELPGSLLLLTSHPVCLCVPRWTRRLIGGFRLSSRWLAVSFFVDVLVVMTLVWLAVVHALIDRLGVPYSKFCRLAVKKKVTYFLSSAIPR